MLPKLFVGPSVFVFGSSGCLSKRMKGWRRFKIADGWASFVRLVGRGADEREKGTDVHASPGREPGDRGPGKKTGRSIRCPARIRPLGKSPNRFRA